ncbi:hypothetical protein KCP73_01590 [Salmonella enterica subsp. enterica]|nr:hypothetical protein KCP73_01590 [Salmonella enterica subsp. enterica]
MAKNWPGDGAKYLSSVRGFPIPAVNSSVAINHLSRKVAVSSVPAVREKIFCRWRCLVSPFVLRDQLARGFTPGWP